MKDYEKFLPGMLDDVYPEPIVADIAPTVNDTGFELGQIWIDKVGKTSHILTHNGGDGSTWVDQGGSVKLPPSTVTAAAAAATLNARVGVVTLTGLTTAAGAQEALTITNSLVTATSGIIVTISNGGTNDARMTLEQVKPAAGSFVCNTQNNGAAQLNGSCVVSFIVLN